MNLREWDEKMEKEELKWGTPPRQQCKSVKRKELREEHLATD